MSEMSWHIDDPTLQAYAAGRLNAAAEASVETHLTTCADCQAGARTLVADVVPLWNAVHDEITRPKLPAPLRALARLGVGEDDLVVLAATRDLLLSWSVAVGAAGLCAIATGLLPLSIPGGPTALFLILAPLVPVLAVAATFDATDPFREVVEVSPYSTLRLALLRTSAALVAAIPLTAAVTLAVPNLHGYFATWLLPGLLITMLTLVLLTWLTAWVAAGLVGTGWVAVASLAASADTIENLTTAAVQLAFAVALVALGTLLVRLTTVQHARGVTP